MKHTGFAWWMALCVVGCVLLCACVQWSWEADCAWYTAQDTPVYTPGTTTVAVTLPAGTACRTEETVGDTWLAIEYMIDGRCFTGMVRAGSLKHR